MAVVAFVLGCAAASSGSEPEPGGPQGGAAAEGIEAEAEIDARIGPAGLIAAWLGVLAALTALYAHERRHYPVGRTHLADRTATLPGALFAASGLEATQWRDIARSRGVRIVGKGTAASSQQPASVSLEPLSDGGVTEPRPAASPEKTTAQHAGIGLGAIQAGEETFRVVEQAQATLAGPAASTEDARPESPAPVAAKVTVPDAAQLSLDLTNPASEIAPSVPPAAPAMAAPTAPAVGQPAVCKDADPADVVRQCAVLRAARRFAEAARLARAGLAAAGDTGALLLELSRAELALGRVETAIDIARDAHFASRSRESVVHLIRLLTETRRFAGEDGLSLRRAVSRHPNQPLLLYAAGIFESMYGKPCEAERLLRAALALAPDEEARRAIGGELARITEARARAV